MKVIVTGGAGFIGSALVRKLVTNSDYEILVIDSLTYASQLLSLEHALEETNLTFSKVDITNFDQVNEEISNFSPDFIFNLAAETHVDRSIDFPEPFIKTNIIGTFNLLQASLIYWSGISEEKKKDFRFLHVSTDEVFGDLDLESTPFTEESKYEPSSPYSASKASSDHLVRAWHRTYNLPVLLTNCSNNYGPFQLYEKLIPLIILKCLRGEKLPIYGSGSQIRDWLYVEDHAEALIRVITKGKIGESYNIGANCEKTNLDLVKEICKIMDEVILEKPKNIKSFLELIIHVDDRPGHDKRYAIDSSKIQDELGWYPSETFDSGLRKTISWFVENSDNIDYEANRIGLRSS